jgi:hypothetical protein
MKEARMLARAILAVGLLILPGCSRTGLEEASAPVSIVKLLATPSTFQGKRVTVIGCVRMELEGTVLYLHREDYENLIPSNAVWLSFGESWPTAAQRSLEGRYVIVEGRFDATHHGHFKIYPGALTDISRLEPWPPASLARPPAQGRK